MEIENGMEWNCIDQIAYSNLIVYNIDISKFCTLFIKIKYKMNFVEPKTTEKRTHLLNWDSFVSTNMDMMIRLKVQGLSISTASQLLPVKLCRVDNFIF